MTIEGLQRTLLVGLGEAGAKTIDLLLADLRQRLGEAGVVQGVVVMTEEIKLTQVQSSLLVSPEAAFESWQADFQKQVEQTLRDISQLNNLARLTQKGIALRHADEIHLIIVANLLETWANRALAGVIHTLRHTVDRILACYTGLTGVLLLIPPAQTGSSAEAEQAEPTTAAAVSAIWSQNGSLNDWLDHDLLLDDFVRGCYLASLTNELGLIVGDSDTLIQRAVYFLTLLIRETPIAGLAWADNGPAGWGTPLSSFGLATIRWPGQELARALSARWTKTLLTQLVTLPQVNDQPLDLPQKVQAAAQQLMTSQKLAPPLLIEQLVALTPPLPNHLAALVPDLPWPWLLVDVQSRLESAARGWQDNWLAGGERLRASLAELESDWARQAETWLQQQLAATTAGVVLVTRSYLAAVSELLRVFIEGVEHNLAEAETDLANLDQRLREVAEALAEELTTFPDTPLAMALYWGPHPLMWLRYWARCRRAQSIARNFAHLSRGRLMAWQTVCFYEEILPFYRRLLTAWGQVVENWESHCRQVTEAAQAPSLANWATRLEQSLTSSAGPWTDSLVTTLYDEAVDRHTDAVWEQAGSFIDWRTNDLEAEEILRRLEAATTHALTPLVAMPIDQALCRQLPAEKARADWLAGMLEQARPFWRYDETTLAESSRTQVQQETWLVLPEADASPLADLGQTWPHPPRLFSSRNPEELGVVTLRRWPEMSEPEVTEESEAEI